MSHILKLKAYFTLLWVFFTFLKLYKWYRITQRIQRKLTASDKANIDTAQMIADELFKCVLTILRDWRLKG